MAIVVLLSCLSLPFVYYSIKNIFKENVFRHKGYLAKNNKTCSFYVLQSDKTWVFDQSERAQGLIYILRIQFI